jgi:hypothetical protein
MKREMYESSYCHDFAKSALLHLYLRADAVYQTSIKHRPRVAQDALEDSSITLVNPECPRRC